MSPTARTKEACKRLGWIAGVTEHWQTTFVRSEYFYQHAHDFAQAHRQTGWTEVQLAAAMERAHKESSARGVRKDLFGFVDLILLCGDCVRYVQVTSGTHMADRVAKIKRECSEAAERLVRTPGVVVEVWAWRKLKGRGRRSWWAKRVAIRYNQAAGELYTYALEDL